MWSKIKQVLNYRDDRQKASHYLSVAKRFGSFGIGTGGQVTQYLLLKILRLDKDICNNYFACGNDSIKQKIHAQNPFFSVESDIVCLRTDGPVEDPYSTSLEAFYQAYFDRLMSVKGISVKTSNKFSKKDSETLEVGCIKAYCAGPAYSSYTFGPMIRQFKRILDDHLAANSKLNSLQWTVQDPFLDYFRHPDVKHISDVFIDKVRQQIRKRLSTDPVKIQFADKQAILFQVPLSTAWKAVNINSFMFSPDYPIEQGKFYVLNENGKTVFSVYGDRIVTGEGFNKDAISDDAVHVPLRNIGQTQFLGKFDDFIDGLEDVAVVGSKENDYEVALATGDRIQTTTISS